jgi:predicted nucleotidyltransferase
MNYPKRHTNHIIETMKTFLIKSSVQEPEIIAVYLFGSYLKEKPRKGSDIDLAFLFDREFYKKDSYRAFSVVQIMGANLGDIIGKAVDISLLNKASLFFSYEVISTGICLYEKNSKERILYEIAIKGQYYDFKPFIMKLRHNKIAYICDAAEKYVR